MLYFMYVFFSPPCCFFLFFLPHLALINGPLLTFTHAPPDVRKLPPAILPVLSFSLFALLSLPLLLLFSPSASTRFVFPCPSPFQTSGFRASYFGLRVLGSLSSIYSFHSSRSIAALGVASARASAARFPLITWP